MNGIRTTIGGALAALGVAAALTPGAVAGGGATLVAASTPRNLWSTVNICDTTKHPDQLGIRARMPAISGGSATMRMRFFAQYMRNGAWVAVPTHDGGTTMSSWIKVGTGKYKWEELGFTFPFSKLKPGDSFRTRGLVKFQWRRHGRVVKSAHAYTAGGHSQKRYGDPKGYSAAECTMSGSV